MAGRFSVEAVFKAVDRITAPVSRMQNRVGKFTRSMSRGFAKLERGFAKFGRALKKSAVGLTAAALITGVALGSVVKTGADFEQAITNVGAVSMQTRAQIGSLEKQALDLGRTTKFTAAQAAGAMEVLARAGFKTQEILKATPAVLAAAAASGLEIADVANHVSNALKGMGLDAGKAAMVADVLALASSRTNSTIGSLGESLSNVASTARQLKIPFTEVTAAVALLQDVGLDASVAGSAFNTMLTKMAAPTTGMQKKMRRFGISFKDAKGDMLPLQKVLEQLSIASNKAGGNFDKVAFLAELVGLRGQKAASNLGMLFETGKLEKLVKELGNAEGSAKKMADIRMDTVQGSFLLLSSAIDAVKVKAFGLSQGPLKTVIDQMTKWVGLNEDLIASGLGDFITNAIPPLKTFAGFMETIATFVWELGNGLGIVAAKLSLIPALSGEGGGEFGPTAFFKRFNTKETGSFGADFDPDAYPSQVVSPQARVAASIEERRTTSTAEVTIKDETGRAEVTGGKMGAGLNLLSSGAF